MDLAGLVVAGISALGTLVQAFYSAKNNNSEIDQTKINQANKRANQALKVGAKTVDDVIADDLLKALSSEIEHHHQLLIDAFSDKAISDSEKAVKVEQARGQICKVLGEIMRFNDGVLPTKRLEKLWASNRCQ
ncbi:hypothetical protein HR060_04880 [Catenovulum sp. SM1970]|uniref:hypothetical protein n=1 Tax=Marinifaba aquimaris TaxID=2741323 RepID=UPI00157190DF|nr:hypothetical protein [Marinifaba aquimaris]NTS76196.1 hypothetical protein [Marinifaba aquimaris]